MGKAMFLTGAAVGYVLGARAGRERYEQICRATESIRGNPKVQQATETVSQRGSEVAHKVADTASEKAHSMAGAATEKAQTMAGAVAEKAPGWMPGSRDTSDTTIEPAMQSTTTSNGRTMS
jgi:hypothetical protein